MIINGLKFRREIKNITEHQSKAIENNNNMLEVY